MFFIYNITYYSDLKKISSCFAHLAALLIALIVREGEIRTLAQNILNHVTKNEELCLKLIEQISNNLEIVEIHFTTDIKQRLEPYLKNSKEPQNFRSNNI